MDRGINGNLNYLISHWKHGTIEPSSSLVEQGFSYDQLSYYARHNWLESFSTGAYKMVNDPVDWTGALYAIQMHHKLSIHPGGKTSLELQGLAHFVYSEINSISLFGASFEKLPRWFKKHNWNLQINYYPTNLFNNNTSLAIHEYERNNYSINISSPERAIMELLYLVPGKQSFDEALLLMENCTTLRPALVQTLLECCISIKVKRLFLFMAEYHDHQWIQKIDPEKVNLGTGKRSIVKNGVLHKKYQITIPREFRKE